MKNLFRTSLLSIAAVLAFSGGAFADDRLRPNVSINELPSLPQASVAAGDYGLIYDTSAINWKKVPALLPGRAVISICGDGTTINNNTIYYGASKVPVASGERTCDITQAGNATEATADAPAFASAFQVISMDCLTADPGAAGVSFTLRASAAATVPSVTCSVANTGTSCQTNSGTTTAIAANAPIAIAAASTGDQGATPFACQIHIAY
jgi:hypothetical protein